MKVERLRALMEEHDMSQAQLARAVGATQGSVQQILSGTTQRSRLLPDIARKFGVSVDYLLGHTDDPRSTRQAVLEGAPVDAVADDRVVAIREVDVSYGMGSGTFVEDYPEEDAAYFGLGFIQRLTRAPSTMLFLATGIGDSMFPTIHDRDPIMFDRTRTRIDVQDRIWAITYGDLGMVKRIRRLPGDRLLVMSDNENISDFEVPVDEVHVIGRAIWTARAL